VEGNLVYEAGVTEEVRPVTDRTRSSEDKNGKTQ
jgi:hypothetical protein